MMPCSVVLLMDTKYDDYMKTCWVLTGKREKIDQLKNTCKLLKLEIWWMLAFCTISQYSKVGTFSVVPNSAIVRNTLNQNT